jgi:hypothetical protein
MAKQFPRAGKPKAGGTKVTSCRSFSRRTSALTNAAPINSLERLKKSGVDFYTSSFGKLRALVVGQNGFSRQKNKFFGGGNTRPVVNRRCTVTTGQLLSHRYAGDATVLLPIWRPNCDFLVRKSTRASPGGRESANLKAMEVQYRNDRTENLSQWALIKNFRSP